MNSIFDALRALLGLESERVEASESGSEESVVRSTDDGDDAPTPPPSSEPPEKPSETYIEKGCSPETFLCRLIRQNGGRILQQEIVRETGWSASTVSRYLVEMEENDSVVRARTGRQKIVGLPDAMDA